MIEIMLDEPVTTTKSIRAALRIKKDIIFREHGIGDEIEKKWMNQQGLDYKKEAVLILYRTNKHPDELRKLHIGHKTIVDYIDTANTLRKEAKDANK